MNRIATLIAAGLFAVARGPGPEHARLTAMSGTWDVEMSFWFQPGAQPVTVKATSTIKSILDGYFIEEQIDGVIAGTAFTTMSWTGYNTSSHQYEATRISSTNTIRIAESGTWNEHDKRLELVATYPLGADTWTQRTFIQPISADSMVAASYLSFGKVPEWKGVEISYKRRPK